MACSNCGTIYSIAICQGATFSLPIQYLDSGSNPIDLTNYGGRMQIRPNVGSADVYITLTSSLQVDGTGLNFSGSNNTSPVSGNILIYISAASSSVLDFDNAVYDLFISSGSYSRVLLEGKVKLDKRVTN